MPAVLRSGGLELLVLLPKQLDNQLLGNTAYARDLKVHFLKHGGENISHTRKIVEVDQVLASWLISVSVWRLELTATRRATSTSPAPLTSNHHKDVRCIRASVLKETLLPGLSTTWPRRMTSQVLWRARAPTSQRPAWILGR